MTKNTFYFLRKSYIYIYKRIKTNNNKHYKKKLSILGLKFLLDRLFTAVTFAVSKSFYYKKVPFSLCFVAIEF